VTAVPTRTAGPASRSAASAVDPAVDAVDAQPRNPRGSGSGTAGDAAARLDLPPLRLGPITVDTPVILAPMAGITNKAFRRLCREYGGGLYVSEMVTSRALVERSPESLRIISHDDDEAVRSVQLYGVDPVTVGAAVRILVEEDRADHIDLNFGCPVPKVTRRGGGAALPWKLDLFTSIVQTAVREASRGGLPLTIKMRKGIDEDHLTFLEAGRIARDSGVAAVALHGRTASQFYSGQADWTAIAELRNALPDIPVLGNGDIWSAEDAVRMVRETGVDGVVVGRGCQGRPWLFGDLMNAFEGSAERHRPGLGQVAETVYRHAELLVDTFGNEMMGLRDIRKHMAWYFKGYVVGGDLRARLATVPTLEVLRGLLAELDAESPYPGADAEGPRGRAGSPKKTSLPQNWLDSRRLNEEQQADISAAELDVSGG
jgi:nifR3 family TIM-barrel protein